MKTAPKVISEAKREKQIVKRCSGCHHLEMAEYLPYPRLWQFLICKAAGNKKCFDMDVCPI